MHGILTMQSYKIASLKRIILLTISLLLLGAMQGVGQAPVRIAGRSIAPLRGSDTHPQQKGARSSSKSSESLGISTNGYRNALVQLSALPSAAEQTQLERAGITLGDYLGGYAYWALVRDGVDLRQAQRGTTLISAVAVRPEWKLPEVLQGHGNTAGRQANTVPSSPKIPAYARTSAGEVKVVIHFAPNATEELVAKTLIELDAKDLRIASTFHTASVALPLQSVMALAECPWVLAVQLQSPPSVTTNYSGRQLGRANILGLPASLGGRGLTGQGVRIGIWDANVTSHLDFGERVHPQEYEMYDTHGTHVAGTVMGAGLIDPDGRGMAPQAEAWTYNFNTQKNGLSAQQEMEIARQRFGISLTQNSYGLALSYLCADYKALVYRADDYWIDFLTGYFPTLTHIFAAGNDGESCREIMLREYGKPSYGTSTNRAKNAIHVGAVNEVGELASTSSRGPQDDGRLFPTICAKGVDVWSTMPGNTYAKMSGTSMACPTVTGTAALIQQRYGQLHQGRHIRADLLKGLLANTATDAGVKGPDFQYGYGIMNGEKATLALEQGQYLFDSVATGDTRMKRIAIPANCRGLRVMLVWTDPPTKKAQYWGDKTLINNLDLSLTANGTPYLPWVCNPAKGKVDSPATRQVDTLNNVEQITLTADELAGTSSVEVTVKGAEVGTGTQRYVLTWWFDGGSPRVVAPGNGELLVPDELAFLNLENVEAPFRLELSYNGGQTYPYSTEYSRFHEHSLIKIPADAPHTSQALIRITDAKGQIATSAHPFTIAPQVQKVSLRSTPCSLGGWQLEWDTVTSATHGYEVLIANPKTAQFTSLGRTNEATACTFTIPPEKMEGMDYPIFTVAVRLPDGTLGKRAANGAVGTATRAVKLTPADIPFTEHFSHYPSRFLGEKHGENMVTWCLNSTLGDLPAGSNVMMTGCKAPNENFNTTDYFAPENADNQTTITLCELDLEGIPADQPLYLHLSGAMVNKDVPTGSTAQMRVLDNGLVLKSIEGTEIQKTTRYDQEWYFALEPGKKHTIAIEYAGNVANDILYFTQLAVERPNYHKAVQLSLVQAPKNGPNLKRETFRLLLENLGQQPLENLLVKAYRSGKWVGSYPVEKLYGHAKHPFEMQVDLATDKALGELVDIAFECVVNPEEPAANARVEHQVNSMGAVIPMGTTTLESTAIGPIPLDPRTVHSIGGTVYFTDNGGYLGNHSEIQISHTQLKPLDRTKKVRVRFLEFNTQDDEAALYVYTKHITNLNTKGERERAKLTGSNLKLPMEFISESPNGEITFYFHAYEQTSAPGWLAVVDLVEDKNPLALLRADATLLGSAPTGQVPIKVRVANRWIKEQKGMKIRVIAGKTNIVQEVDLPQGEQEIVLDQKLELPLGTSLPMQVAIEGEDTHGADNEINTFAIYDRYCIPPAYGTSAAVADTITALQKRYPLSRKATGAIRYALPEKAVTLYKEEGETPVTISTQGTVPPGCSMAAWVDWDDNGEFTQEERATAPLLAGKNSLATLTLNPTAAQPGLKRMRIAIAPTGRLSSPCNSTEDGDVQDCYINLLDGHYPEHGDLAITQVDAGGWGKPRSEQEVKITIKNLSNSTFTGKLKATLTVDGGTPQEEELTCSDVLPPYTGTTTLTLANKAVLTTVGKHTVRVEIEEMPASNKANNTANTDIWIAVPQTDGDFYALNIESYQRENERIAVNSVAEKLSAAYMDLNGPKPITLEAVFRTDRAQFGELISAPGLRVFTTYLLAGYPIPDNAILVQVGGIKLLWSGKGTITPGKWHHIALVFNEISFLDSKVHLFIDGAEVPLTNYQNQQGHPTFDNENQQFSLGLMPKVDGRLKLFRAWAEDKTAELPGLQYTYVRQADNTLPQGCLAEFTFDEGPRNALSLSPSGDVGTITAGNDARIEATDGGIWQKVNALIASIQFDHQNSYAEVVENQKYEITFALGTPKTTPIKGVIAPAWPTLQFTYKGAAIDANTPFDFTSGQVTITASGQLFGRTINQEISLVYKEDASGAADLTKITLSKAANPGLKDDITTTVSSRQVGIAIPESKGRLENPAKTRLTYEISPAAKLFHNGQELPNGGELDLTAPTVVEVVAANGHRQGYELRLAQEQSIVWTPTKTAFTYGDTPVAVDAIASSGQKLTFTSSNAAVATVLDGKLIIGTPGSTTITALQPGENGFGPATPVAHEITVAKKAIDITPKIADVPLGKPIAWDYNFTTLVKQEDIWSMPNPLGKNAFRVLNADNEELPVDAILPIGIYTAKAGSGYEDSNYIYTPKDATFSVVQGKLWAVTLTVVTPNGDPIPDAAVLLGKADQRTNTQGICQWCLEAGSQYPITVMKEGYGTVNETVDLTEGASIARTITLQPATITLTYTAGSHGTLLGNAVQKLASGNAGEAVWAVPETGYRFDKWSDGQANNPRLDTAVTHGFTVEAAFSKQTYTLTYSLEAGGRLASGAATQTVEAGADGAEVTVEPEEGYFFVGWSDGNTSPARTERAVSGNVAIVARFAKYQTLPHFNDFEARQLSDGWYSISTGKTPAPWAVTNLDAEETKCLDGYYALIDGNAYGQDANVESYLYSPKFRLEGVTTDVIFSADYWFCWFSGADEFDLEYSVDGGAWTQLGTVERDDKRRRIQETIPVATLQNRQTLQFRWHYKAVWGYFAMIDNVAVVAAQSEPFTLSYVADPAEAGTFWIPTSTGFNQITQQRVNQGGFPAPVTARPASNYRFYKWSDGTTSILLQPQQPVFASQTITARFVKMNEAIIAYRANPEEGGHFTIDGQPAVEQLVAIGTVPKAVTAVPAQGYRLAYWNDNGDTNPTHVLSQKTRDNTEVVATFVRIQGQAVTIEVTDGKNPLPDALVKVGGDSIATGADGKALFDLKEGTYTCTVTKEGYQRATKVFAVASAPVTLQVALSPKDDNPDPTVEAQEPLAHVEALPNPFSAELTLSGLKDAERVRIFDARGLELLSTPTNGVERITLQLEHIPTGVYLVVVEGQRAQRSLRVVKM